MTRDTSNALGQLRLEMDVVAVLSRFIKIMQSKECETEALTLW